MSDRKRSFQENIYSHSNHYKRARADGFMVGGNRFDVCGYPVANVFHPRPPVNQYQFNQMTRDGAQWGRLRQQHLSGPGANFYPPNNFMSPLFFEPSSSIKKYNKSPQGGSMKNQNRHTFSHSSNSSDSSLPLDRDRSKSFRKVKQGSTVSISEESKAYLTLKSNLLRYDSVLALCPLGLNLLAMKKIIDESKVVEMKKESEKEAKGAEAGSASSNIPPAKDISATINRSTSAPTPPSVRKTPMKRSIDSSVSVASSITKRKETAVVVVNTPTPSGDSFSTPYKSGVHNNRFVNTNQQQGHHLKHSSVSVGGNSVRPHGNEYAGSRESICMSNSSISVTTPSITMHTSAKKEAVEEGEEHEEIEETKGSNRRMGASAKSSDSFGYGRPNTSPYVHYTPAAHSSQYPSSFHPYSSAQQQHANGTHRMHGQQYCHQHGGHQIVFHTPTSSQMQVQYRNSQRMPNGNNNFTNYYNRGPSGEKYRHGGGYNQYYGR